MPDNPGDADANHRKYLQIAKLNSGYMQIIKVSFEWHYFSLHILVNSLRKVKE